MLSDVRMLIEIRIQPASLYSFAESKLMHPWGTRGDHHSINTQLLYVVLDEVLSRIRAHVFVVAGNHYVRQGGRIPGHSRRIHCASDIQSAVADINTNLYFFFHFDSPLLYCFGN